MKVILYQDKVTGLIFMRKYSSFLLEEEGYLKLGVMDLNIQTYNSFTTRGHEVVVDIEPGRSLTEYPITIPKEAYDAKLSYKILR